MHWLSFHDFLSWVIFVQHKESLIVPSIVVQAGNDKAHDLVPFDVAHTMSLCFTLILTVPFILNDLITDQHFNLNFKNQYVCPQLCYHWYSAFTHLSNPREDAGRPQIKVNHETYTPHSSRRRKDAGRFSKRHHAPPRHEHCKRQTTACIIGIIITR